MRNVIVLCIAASSVLLFRCAGGGEATVVPASSQDDDAGGPAGTAPAQDGGGGAGDTPEDAGPTSEGSAPPAASDGATGGPDAGDAGYGPYAVNGPDTYATSSIQVPAPNGTFTATAYVPALSTPMPVVILSSGLQQPGAAYAPYAERLASWGIVTILRDDPGVLGEASPAIAEDVSYEITTWLATANTTSSGPLDGKVDTTRIGLAGHSRGGQVSLLAAEGGAHGLIRGLFGLDPVDSSSDGGVGEATAGIADVGVPMAFIGETTDSAASSCAPAAYDYLSMYAAAPSPIEAITALGADHTMFELPSECQFCTLCTAGTASSAQVIATAERYLMAFFARQLLGDSSVGAALEGAGTSLDVAAGLITVESK